MDLLRLRLQELDPVVDYFILIEANLTHSKLPKPFYFQEHRHLFTPYLDKIIYVQLDAAYLLAYSGESHWDRETLQRDAVMRGLQAYGAGPDDLVIVSDLDEIPMRDLIRDLRDCREATFPALLTLDW